MIALSVAVAVAQVQEHLVAEVLEMNAFSWIFMLVSMGSVTGLTIWCFWRILRTKEHFDPDGTGPAHSPVQGRVDESAHGP